MRLTSWNLLHGTPIPASADQTGLLKRAIDALKSDVIGVSAPPTGNGGALERENYSGVMYATIPSAN